MAGKPKELVSQAAQTVFRDSESQYLIWDITKQPTQHPSKFPRGRGLKYPVLYDPAWPVSISAKKKVIKPPRSQKKTVIGSYALTGITLSETERRPIKKTLIFPHRNSDLPFRQPIPKVVKEPAYEPCETLTLKAVEELESKVVYKSILESIPRYDANDTKARAAVLRKVLQLGPGFVEDPGPPVPRRRKPKRRRSKIRGADKGSPSGQVGIQALQIIFVDEGLSCGIHGATIDGSKVKNCEIHGDSGVITTQVAAGETMDCKILPSFRPP